MPALFFHTFRLSGSPRNVVEAIESIEGLDQTLQVFDEEPVVVFDQNTTGADLRGVGYLSPDSLEALEDMLREMSGSRSVAVDWFANSSSNGFHTTARRYGQGSVTVLFDGPYYLSTLAEAEDAGLASKGCDAALGRLVTRFFTALKGLGRQGSYEDDARALALAWHLSLGESIVPRLLVEEPDPGSWKVVLEALTIAQERSDVLDFGEMENIETLFREVIHDGAVQARESGERRR